MRMQTFLIFCLPEVVYHSLTGHNRTFFFFTSLKVASGLVWPDHATWRPGGLRWFPVCGSHCACTKSEHEPLRVRLLEIGDRQRV